MHALVAAASGVLLVIATAGVASAKTVSDQKYAEAYCSAFEDALASLDDIETEAQSSSDAGAFQATALTGIDSVLASLEGDAAKLQKLSPEDGGKKAAKVFDEALAGFSAGIQTARDEFAAVDPGSGAFSEATGTLLVAVVGAADGFDAPLSELGKHKDLRRAVGRSCDIVRVTRS